MIEGRRPNASAEEVLRARFTGATWLCGPYQAPKASVRTHVSFTALSHAAFIKDNRPYLLASTHPDYTTK